MVKTWEGVKAQWSTESLKFVVSPVKSGITEYTVFLEGQLVTRLI
jgi:hypothetical protein